LLGRDLRTTTKVREKKSDKGGGEERRDLSLKIGRA